jgi:DNA-binding transcriptional LysR family regulator
LLVSCSGFVALIWVSVATGFRARWVASLLSLRSSILHLVLPLETLDALDLTLWLGSEVMAAKRLGCNQSTVSRRLKTALNVFGARLVRRNGELRLAEPCPLLAMQREVHQLARLLGHGQLRLELNPGVGRELSAGMSSRRCVGRAGGIGSERRLALLRERLVDVWLATEMVDLPGGDDTPFQVFALARVPMKRTSALNDWVAVVVRSDVADSPAIAELLADLTDALKVHALPMGSSAG